jgi:hypothetical protein
VNEIGVFVAAMVGAFVLAAVPVFQSLGGQVASLQSTSDSLFADLTRLLAQSNGYSDFFSPYLFVGAIPAVIAMAAMGIRKDVHPLEIGLVGSFLALILFWALFWHWGPALVRAVPGLALFKDFIKLQIVMAVPLTVASIACLRWLGSAFKAGSPRALIVPLTAVTLALVIGPEWITAGPAIRSGQLGLNADSKVPATYAQVFDRLHAIDSNSDAYRVLWIPMDFRVFRSFESLQPETLLYRDDSSPEAKAAVLNTYQAIAGDQLETISPLLATEGVKYVVLDLVDGQKPGEPWQTGPKSVVSVFGTYLLTGSETEYRALLDNTPGLGLVIKDKYLVYKNLEWRPVLKSYAGILTVPAAAQEARSGSSPGQGIGLAWKSAVQGVNWRLQADQSVRIEAVNAPPGQSIWSSVSASIPVVGGASYLIGGDMHYDQVFQSHAKIDWRSSGFGKDVTTSLVAGHDGTGAASLGQVVVAPAGASFADIVLMGGWNQGSAGFTVFSGLTVQALTSPDLSALAAHPDQLLSLWSELPNLLIEAGAQVQPQSLAAVNWLSLSDEGGSASSPSSAVHLFTPSELTLAGKWGINAQPDRLGIEHFVNHGGGSISVPQDLLTSAPIGSQLVWTEYTPSDTEPSSGVTSSVGVSRGAITLRCTTSNCTIANVMLVPPLLRKGRVARLAYAYSPLLRTPDGERSPVRLAGDWASIYSPPPQADPSGLYDRSAIGRILGLVFGYFVIVASSLVLLFLRL